MHARSDLFLVAQLGWMVTSTVFFTLLDLFSYELFFVSSFFGLLFITGYLIPSRVTTTWQKRIRWLIVAGVVIFIAMILKTILALLPPETF